MNQIIVKGRLVRDPESKTIATRKGDMAVCDFTVATDRMYGEGADFFNCQAWGKTGEIVEKFFFKGKEILVSGSMECDPYENKEGKKVYPWRLKVGRVEFCGSKKDDPVQSKAPEGFTEVDDDDIPF